MLKWARARLNLLIGRHADRVNAIESATVVAQPSLNMAAAAQRVSKRLVALSSAGFDSPAAEDILSVAKSVAARTSLNARRPGVHARWKEQNRVPFQRLA